MSSDNILATQIFIGATAKTYSTKVYHKTVGCNGEVLPADLHVKWSGVNTLALVREMLLPTPASDNVSAYGLAASELRGDELLILKTAIRVRSYGQTCQCHANGLVYPVRCVVMPNHG